MTAPLLTAFVQGLGSVGADNLNTFEQTCDNYAELRGLTGLPGMQVFCRGEVSPNDGGQGNFYWDPNALGADNNSTILTPTGDPDQGRWVSITYGGAQTSYFWNSVYPPNTIGDAVHNNTPLTPFDFASLVTGGVVAAGQDDTPAFVALAAAYTATGRRIHMPDLGGPYLVKADQVIFTPPPSYNAAYRIPPAITMDKSAIIRATSSGTFLIQLGTLASDYSGFLRQADFDLGEIDGNNFTFTKAPLYVPFFLDCRINSSTRNAVRCAWYGDTSAPTASAGLKGKRSCDRDLDLWAANVATITNAVNPTVTLSSANPNWATSGAGVVCIDTSGVPTAWTAINNLFLDITILTATTFIINNIDSTGFGSWSGTGTVYLNFASNRVSKQITGVTNANPCVITTAVNHLFNNGNTVDIAEIFSMPTLIGQFTATVLSATTFSIPVNTTSTSTWGSWGSTGPGWAMQWVPFNQCDIGEYYDNASDIDDSECYIKNRRVGIYNNPTTSGYDGKKAQAHFYNLIEAGEILCAYYLGGDNNCVQTQCDGPFRYVFWAFGPRNSSTQCSTNYNLLNSRPPYGCLVRTETGAGWNSLQDRLKSAFSGYSLFAEHVGLGTFGCLGTIYLNLAFPIEEIGEGRRAAAVGFSMIDGTVKAQFQAGGGPYARTTSGFANGDRVITFVRPVPLEAYQMGGVVGAAAAASSAATMEEDYTWSGRSVFQRRIITRLAGTPTDFDRVWVEYRYSS